MSPGPCFIWNLWSVCPLCPPNIGTMQRGCWGPGPVPVQRVQQRLATSLPPHSAHSQCSQYREKSLPGALGRDLSSPVSSDGKWGEAIWRRNVTLTRGQRCSHVHQQTLEDGGCR